jgi:hypothetical protein
MKHQCDLTSARLWRLPAKVLARVAGGGGLLKVERDATAGFSSQEAPVGGPLKSRAGIFQ